MLIDTIAPTCDVSARHAIWIAAAPGHVYEVARRLDVGRSSLVRLLMGLRAVPAVLAFVLRNRRPMRSMASGECSIREGAVTFTLVAEAPGEEFVLGLMGRFWTLSGGVVPATADRFNQPPPAGLAQALWNFRVRPSGAGTELSTETRVRCGDEATRRRFSRYWRIIRFGSGLIRRSMLRQIRAVAERRATLAGKQVQ
jgi:hypothetical protein